MSACEYRWLCHLRNLCSLAGFLVLVITLASLLMELLGAELDGEGLLDSELD
jgi:hypothetical protein